MQIYKAFFKIIYKNLAQIMIYAFVFIFFAVLLTVTNGKSQNPNFTETKVNIVFINRDSDSKLVEGFRNYLKEKGNIIDIPDDSKKLQDALFFRQAEYIIKIPKGFTEAMLKGEIAELERSAVPNSVSEIYMDNMINKYLNTIKIYETNLENLSEEELVNYVNKDLSQDTKVELSNPREGNSKSENEAYYFNYMAYSLFSILILGVSSVMLAFNNTDLKRRNLCTPVKLRSMNLQLIAGNLSFAVLVWLVMIIVSFVMSGSYMLTKKGGIFLLNSFVFTFAVLSISFLIGNIIKNRNAMSAAANIFSLGTSFISGVFVSQQLLGKTVLKISSFTPVYWYVKSNNSLADMTIINMDNLRPIFLNISIIAGFAIAMLAVSLVLIKQKRIGN